MRNQSTIVRNRVIFIEHDSERTEVVILKYAAEETPRAEKETEEAP